MRTHGSRNANEVWSYGKQAEPILEKYLKLRYQLLPYIYSLGYNTYQTGAPSMRALFMDFPNDPSVAEIGDEYMFGPAFLVAPITVQGATSRQVYLPAGADWYNYWTNQRFPAAACSVSPRPLIRFRSSSAPDPSFLLGAPILSTNEDQKIAKVLVYPGANADFTLYSDDGKTYDYEKGKSSITHLHWDDAAKAVDP